MILEQLFGPSNPNYTAVNRQLTYEDQMEIKKQYFFVIDTPDFAINIIDSAVASPLLKRSRVVTHLVTRKFR